MFLLKLALISLLVFSSIHNYSMGKNGLLATSHSQHEYSTDDDSDNEQQEGINSPVANKKPFIRKQDMNVLAVCIIAAIGAFGAFFGNIYFLKR